MAAVFPQAFSMTRQPMFPKPKSVLVPNTYEFESGPMVKATGFREYDARWLFEKEINLMGVQALGMGLGALIAELGVKQEIVTGHDFRGYSASIKYALITGLMAAGCKVHDIGLAVTPMAYFAQFDLDVPCVAMVTASHNDNGWTGVKMGANRPLTFGPDEMTRLKDIVLNARFELKGGGSYSFVENFPARYIADLTSRPKIKRTLKVVCACANGAKTEYWKTGHSYMKRRVNEIGALAGFEKSGHFFFNKPIGRGYDDGLIFALAVCDMLDRNPGKSMADLKNALPKTWSSPTMAPHCPDEVKYQVVEEVVKHFEQAKARGEKVAGEEIRDLVTVNGVRVTVADGPLGMVGASSNKPELVVVVESPVSEPRMRDMFKAIDGVLRTHRAVGAYNQTI